MFWKWSNGLALFIKLLFRSFVETSRLPQEALDAILPFLYGKEGEVCETTPWNEQSWPNKNSFQEIQRVARAQKGEEDILRRGGQVDQRGKKTKQTNSVLHPPDLIHVLFCKPLLTCTCSLPFMATAHLIVTRFWSEVLVLYTGKICSGLREGQRGVWTEHAEV